RAASAMPGSAMPYLQLDVPSHYPVDLKRGLARRLGDSYARIMQTTPELVTVAFRELGDGGVGCCGVGEPEPAALISFDIRRGRRPERLEADGAARAVQIAQHVDGPVKVVWTREEDIQHDMYRPYWFDRLSAGLDAKGMPVAWNNRFAGSSVASRWASGWF